MSAHRRTVAPTHSVRFRQGQRVDFVVVGSGAAGGIVAKELATRGFTVLVLEQGPRVASPDFHHDDFAKFMLSEHLNASDTQPQRFRQGPGSPFTRQMFSYYHRLVGGGSVMFTANYWRFREIDFVERTRLGAIAGTDFDDWPITYADLEPYYTKAEWELGVSGQRGPFDPPRSRRYPLPPLPVKSAGVLFERGARALGLHPQPAPMCILSRPYRGRNSCQHCGFCLGFGCEHGAKSSTLVSVIPMAEATGRCEIRAECYVSRVETDTRGRAAGVTYFDARKREHFQPARAVVLCANGAETPRLLLMSATTRFPDGLANSSGMVGKRMMINGYCEARGVFDQPLNEWKSVAVTRILWDFYDSDPARGFYGGGGMDGRSGMGGVGGYPVMFALDGLAPDAPRWGAGYKRALRETFSCSMSVAGHGTSLPVESNAVDLDPDLRDAWGLPCMRATYRDHDDDVAMMRFLTRKGKEILDAAGARRAWEVPVTPQTVAVHLLGTCRMGNDPRRSVVDRYHRTHDLRNLFLCDGSSFVTSGRGQPTCTIQALAYRAGEHIARFARRNEI